MIYFLSDYSLGAHPKILEAFNTYNLEHNEGYGLDHHSKNAEKIIKELIDSDQSHVHMMVGGTPSNITLIASALRPYESVIAPKSGHIYSHETGAIEATGHRVVTVESKDGKLTPEMIDTAFLEHEDEHTPLPGLVYISQPTEIGTLYSKQELIDLYKKCEEKDVLLYIDGARLGAALTAEDNDMTLQDLAHLCDAFYIGGTKNGALFGEALVINHEKLNDHFRYMMKRQGALFAKGQLIGLQFETLFDNKEESIYFEMAKHANTMAKKLHKELEALGIKFYGPAQTNQIFPILPTPVVEELEKDFAFYRWAPEEDGMTSIRLVTSWGTKEEEVDAFVKALKDILERES